MCKKICMLHKSIARFTICQCICAEVAAFCICWICAWVLTCRDCHRYRKPRGFEVTGFAGMGMVVEFSTLRHTAYPYCGIMGIQWIYYNMVSIFLKLIFSHIWSLFVIVSHRDATKYGHASCMSSVLFTLTLTQPASKQSKLHFYILKTN